MEDTKIATQEIPIESCPYCDWTGRSVKKHLIYCSENPDNRPKAPAFNILDHKDNVLDGLDYYLSAWKQRYSERKRKGSDPVVRKYESMKKTRELVENIK